jgi:23S rRNA (uracil1939-C5)-methyltransferase
LSCVITEVHEASPHRIDPDESHYLSCSPWQVLAREHESAWKIRLVRELYEQQHQITLPEFDLVTDTWLGYRNKLEFSFLDTEDGVSLAFFQRENYRRKQAHDGCLLGAAALNQAGRNIRDVLRHKGINADKLKSLVVRCNQGGQVAAGLYVTESIPSIAPQVATIPNITGMRVFLSNPQTPAAVAGALLEEYGVEVLQERVLDRRFCYSDRSFFQIHVPLLELVLRDMRPFVAAETQLYDLYAGVGTMGICLGGNNTVFVESEPDCVAFLEQNCRANGISPAQILAAPVEKALDTIASRATVVLDPPRAGIHPRVLKRLGQALPQRILYLSCNAQTQARDVAVLLPHYQLVMFRAYNFFPRTPRMETLAVLDRIHRA